MHIYKHQYQYGWDGDNGIGDQLILQIVSGIKTATCAPKVAYTPEELQWTYSLVGEICTVTDKKGIPRCNVRHLAVFETTFGHPDPRLVKGEGNGSDVRSFQADHISAWKGMAADGILLTDEAVLIVELFELVESVSLC